VEARDTLVFEGKADIVHVDADGREVAHDVASLVDVCIDGAHDSAVVLVRCDGDFRQRVHGVWPDDGRLPLE